MCAETTDHRLQHWQFCQRDFRLEMEKRREALCGPMPDLHVKKKAISEPRSHPPDNLWRNRS